MMEGKSSIPPEIIDLAATAISRESAGWAKEAARVRLFEVRDYINNVLGEPATCARCGKELVVCQHLDYVNLPEGKVCIACIETAG